MKVYLGDLSLGQLVVPCSREVTTLTLNFLWTPCGLSALQP